MNRQRAKEHAKYEVLLKEQ